MTTDDLDSPQEDESDEMGGSAGDLCPFCKHFNSPPADDICEHVVAWVWDGQVEALGRGRAFARAFDGLRETVSAAEEDPRSELILDHLGSSNRVRARLIDTEPEGLEEALSIFASAEPSGGWSTAGMLSGSGYTLCVPEPTKLDDLAAECKAIVDACNLEILTENTSRTDLESLRPARNLDWQLVASGFWSEDTYHSGHIAYYIANIGPGSWLLDGVERNAILDDVTQEDVDQGQLNDDQIQAMWGMTLEEAQSKECRRIRAACVSANEALSARAMAEILYRAVCDAGGIEIDEADEIPALLDLR